MDGPTPGAFIVRPYVAWSTDSRDIADIAAESHATRTTRPDWWWHALPTFVAVAVTERPPKIVGYAQFSLAPMMIFLYDTGVRLTKRLFRPIAERLLRSPSLPKWSLTIQPRPR